MRGRVRKPFLLLDDKPIIAHTLFKFQRCDPVDEIIPIVSAEDIGKMRQIVGRYSLTKVTEIVAGGETRQRSVYNGLKAMSDETKVVVIHDGVRPFVTDEIIRRCIEMAFETGAAIAAVPVKDTIKEVSSDGIVLHTLERSRLWAIQTPQAFRRELILRGHELALERGMEATDDAALIEMMGYKVPVVVGSYKNIKITTPEDLILARALLCG
ncbi:TPA: 2-C-methyl-D-erythritol 4-phosphate cytidylyltransferase [Candidatus Poribacteria bacterium]|nr:2-C-methyl-D-erythritol 4-phosphate cytidylyltransferase [Candidatus Poribacteria bacterium]